jgi:ATP-dependent RNA helicase RhlE
LDEADKMLSMGFKEELDLIISKLPLNRQNLLFSATLTKVIGDIKQVLLNDPLVISIEEAEVELDQINELAYHVQEERKGPLLRYLIKEQDLQQVLVFTSSAKSADKIENKLSKNGIQAISIHSKKSQFARTDALSRFKDGQLRVLVTTDLLARGIDIEFLPCVINYELPRSPKDYIHRIGRTGRAESSGEAISFITEKDKQHFRVIQKKTGKWATMIDSESLDLKGY